MDEQSTPTGPAETAPEAARTGLVSRRWPRRGTWILLGRTLGGFGAFIAALIAAAEFAFDRDPPSPTTGATSESTLTGYDYVDRRDDTGQIHVELPTAWGNVDSGQWAASGIRGFAEGAPLGAKLVAAPNVTAWRAAGELGTPGMLIGVSPELPRSWTARALAQAFNYDGCEFASEEPYAAGRLTGWLVRSACNGTATRWMTLAATFDGNPSPIVLVQAKLVTDRDTEAFDRSLATLEISEPS